MSVVGTRICFIDVDGTLVGPNGVDERVWPALDRLRGAGWRIAICTGRPGRGDALTYAQKVDPEGLHVFESGACVARGDGTVHHADVVPNDKVAAALALARAHAVTAEAYTAQGDYHAPVRDGLVAQHEALLGYPATIGPVLSTATCAIVRVQWVVADSQWASFEPHARALAVDAGTIHIGRSPKMPDHRFVAFVAPGVSKESGGQVVADAYGTHLRDAVMIGDNLNDMPLLRAVGTAIVVDDGAPEALALASIVIPSAAVGGVADAVGQLLEGR